jgi:3-methyladenine DNA glycosylase AlkD
MKTRAMAKKSSSKKVSAVKTVVKARPVAKKAAGSAAKTPAKSVGAKKVAAAEGKSSGPSVAEILEKLESMGDPKVRAQYTKYGMGENQFGIKHGDIRVLAKQIKTNHPLALELWATGNADAQLLAILLMKPTELSADELERLVKSVEYPKALVHGAAFSHVGDWLHSYVTKEHPDKEKLRQKWMTSKDRWCARAAWRLTAGRVVKSPEGIDIEGLLDRLEAEMGKAAPEVQWTMNTCLGEIGINHPKHRKRAIAIGEKFGLYKTYPVSKGCTSPFAPDWIEAMVKRQGA